MLYRLGRFLQLLGLVVAPVGLVGNLSRPDVITVGRELVILTAGIGLFTLGWLFQRAAKNE